MKQRQSPAAKGRPDIPAILRDAMGFHRQGVLDEAQRRYEDILAIQPNHFDARHLLGVIRFQQGRHDEALEIIRAALNRIQGLPRHCPYGGRPGETRPSRGGSGEL